jgi:4-coumarate--CoA ligase
MRRFETEAFLKTIQDQKITEFLVVPPMVVAIIKSDLAREYSMASIGFSCPSAAPLATPTQLALQKLLPPDAKFTQIFGMTELTCTATMFHWPENDNTGSVGRPLPGLEIK